MIGSLDAIDRAAARFTIASAPSRCRAHSPTVRPSQVTCCHCAPLETDALLAIVTTSYSAAVRCRARLWPRNPRAPGDDDGPLHAVTLMAPAWSARREPDDLTDDADTEQDRPGERRREVDRVHVAFQKVRTDRATEARRAGHDNGFVKGAARRRVNRAHDEQDANSREAAAEAGTVVSNQPDRRGLTASRPWRVIPMNARSSTTNTSVIPRK
jgi:hypothetical protein